MLFKYYFKTDQKTEFQYFLNPIIYESETPEKYGWIYFVRVWSIVHNLILNSL